MDPLHINIFHQYLADYSLNLTMHLFSLIQSLLLLIFCIDDLEYMAAFDYVLTYFHLHNRQNWSFIFTYQLCFASLPTFPTLIPKGYDVILSKVCNILSSLLLSAVLLISSVCTLCTPFSNLCCDFNIASLFNKPFLKSLNLSLRCITCFFLYFAFLSLLPSSIK